MESQLQYLFLSPSNNEEIARIIRQNDYDIDGFPWCWIEESSMNLAYSRRNYDLVLLLLTMGANPNYNIQIKETPLSEKFNSTMMTVFSNITYQIMVSLLVNELCYMKAETIIDSMIQQGGCVYTGTPNVMDVIYVWIDADNSCCSIIAQNILHMIRTSLSKRNQYKQLRITTSREHNLN